SPALRGMHGTHRERIDLDRLYMSEMATSTVLRPAEEVELGQAIAAAERSMLNAIGRAPAGARALERLSAALASGTIHVRDVLPTPDEEGLDRNLVSERLQRVLARTASEASEEREHIVNTLAETRLDGDLVDELAQALEDERTPEDLSASAIVEDAREDLRRS